ncbi:MAG: hypothetical protein P4L41_05575 [Flavipsychrobacter sp.]|nr:hypothetical protein [Flavipsychrobacter sp.]
MKRYCILLTMIPALIFASCTKNTLSKIPQISLAGFIGDSLIAGSADTVSIYISFTDGDADLGVNPNNTQGYYDIYLKDSRYDTGYVGYFFPTIDPSAEVSSKGLSGTILFQQPAALLHTRPDSLHMKYGDTLNYEIYIEDRARHQSNHITTPTFIIRP